VAAQPRGAVEGVTGSRDRLGVGHGPTTGATGTAFQKHGAQASSRGGGPLGPGTQWPQTSRYIAGGPRLPMATTRRM
jgi:hypothetical protein